MKFDLRSIPRAFSVGKDMLIKIKDYGRIFMESNEQITLCFDKTQELDVACKEWGFYATPSLNHRLVNQGFRTALVKNSQSRYYIMVVSNLKVDAFIDYCRAEDQTIVSWLSDLS
jgi:hypothetical protein